MNTFLCYQKCSTCKKAEKWLKDHNIPYEIRWINEENPTAEELRSWAEKSGKDVGKFFNTSGQLYRSMGLKEKRKTMTEDEMIALLAADGMLVKRPVFLSGEIVLVGFHPQEWEESLLSR